MEAYDRDGYRPTLDDILEGKSGAKQDQDVEEGEVKEGKVRIDWLEYFIEKLCYTYTIYAKTAHKKCIQFF